MASAVHQSITKRPAKFAVVGTSKGGAPFRIERYHERWEADDFAAEVKASGGTARVEPIRKKA